MPLPPDRLMRLKEVLDLTGLRRATLYRKIRTGNFPRQVRISERCAAWRESAIRSWLANPAGWAASEA
jgi:prophage regulatory protein